MPDVVRRWSRAEVLALPDDGMRAEYWVVDAESELVERWRPDDVRPEVLQRTLTWRPSSGAIPLEIDLAALFADEGLPPATQPS